MSRVELSRTAVRALATSSEMKTEIGRRCEFAADAVRAAAPDQTGYYRRNVVAGRFRVFVNDFAWHLVEYGSANNPPYAPVRRGVRAVGLRLTESRT